MFWLDAKYLELVSSRIDKFKRKSPNLWLGRCLFCEDSKLNKYKARGYFFECNDGINYFCHNCSISLSFSTYLKRVDARLFADYQIEKLKFSGKQPHASSAEVLERFDDHALELMRLKTIRGLPKDHEARIYFTDRVIPDKNSDLFRWAPQFQTWTNFLIPGKFSKESMKYECGRVIIPFFNRKKQFIGYQGRSLGAIEPRYYSIHLKKDDPMLFNIDNLNFNKDILVFEGPIDSCFLDNATAIAGSNFAALTGYVPRDKIVMCYDNEKFNKDTRGKIVSAIDQGLRVVIWPEYIGFKDINLMILNGFTKQHIEQVIKENTFGGLQARTRFTSWSK